uniref:XRN 5'-3' exonuclease n=1 Tax=Marseillevirus LCMAC101 TaxID=2506602 RepID=A0A481YT79_9VIRU|nr:MAG: XRN 5'-3' exonuclease [Marseillevirus LCMAC101]
MGVPRLFPYTKDHFPKHVRHFRRGEHTQKVDYLYLDANGPLHTTAQYVENYGQNKRLVDRYGHLSEAIRQKMIFAKFFEEIYRITQIVKPQKVLYIAIDGPAPLAKQCQQRQRRFMAAKDRDPGTFDSNNMTPGTVFMFNMTKYLNYSIRKEMNGFSLWKDIEVIFSPPTVPSEGEHKILDFMRSLPDDELQNSSHCIFGPDGDLIMLTLAAHVPKMLLLREDQYNVDHIHLLDMGKIRKDLPSFMGQPATRSLNDVADDFIFQGFFVGNDFLPKIQMFHRLEDGLEKMVSTYQKVISTNSTSGKEKNLVIDGELNLEGFYEFISLLAEEEEYYLSRQVRVKPPEEKFTNKTLLNNISTDKNNNQVFDFKSYRQDYYAKMGIDLKNSGYKKKIKDLCHCYIKTLIWVFEYYIKGLPSWRWAYEYHYAPLMYDLGRHLSVSIVKGDTYTFDHENASVPFEQLLSVLPTLSAELLPNPYRKLMINPSSELVKLGYYPEQFDIDFEGKDKDFQGVVLLPFVDYQKVHRCYEKMKKHVKTQYARNQLGKNILFWFDSTYNARYTSDMGSILNLRVRSKELDPLRV